MWILLKGGPSDTNGDSGLKGEVEKQRQDLSDQKCTSPVQVKSRYMKERRECQI